MPRSSFSEQRRPWHRPIGRCSALQLSAQSIDDATAPINASTEPASCARFSRAETLLWPSREGRAVLRSVGNGPAAHGWRTGSSLLNLRIGLAIPPNRTPISPGQSTQCRRWVINAANNFYFLRRCCASSSCRLSATSPGGCPDACDEHNVSLRERPGPRGADRPVL